MSFSGKLRQYIIIIERIKNKQLPVSTANDLIMELEKHDLGCSPKTLERIRENLFADFNIAIEVNRSNNTYYIDYANSDSIPVFLSFLHTSLQAQFVAGTIKDFKKLSKFIHISTNSLFKGLDMLEPLLEAIKESVEIEFSHENYFTFKHKNYKLQPYILKEYLNRWYVVGNVPEINEFRTFGIDRIENLKNTNTKFRRKNSPDPRKFFDDTIGLVYTDHELQEVVIQATEHQAKYINSLPLHSSHKPLPNFQFSYLLTPNIELIQRILMMGSEVQVLKPDWLREKVKKILKDALEKYK